MRVVGTSDGFYTADNTTGQRLGELTGVRDRDSVPWLETGTIRALWNPRLAPGGWQLTRYELPALRPGLEILLPGRNGGRPLGDRGGPPRIAVQGDSAADGGRVFAIGDGVLTGWDVEPDGAAARQVGPPIPLGTTELQVGFHRTFPHMRVRPGHPDQVAVLGIDEVQIWDVPLGRMVTAVPAEPELTPLDEQDSPIAFDASGDRLAVLARDGTLQLWDVGAATQVRAPIPAPAISNLLRFDADGYLVVARDDDSGPQQFVAFINLDSGFEAGSFETNNAIGQPEIAYLAEDRRALRLEGLGYGWTLDMPVTAQDWRDGLCSLVDRPFTPGEEQLLPEGTRREPACR